MAAIMCVQEEVILPPADQEILYLFHFRWSPRVRTLFQYDCDVFTPPETKNVLRDLANAIFVFKTFPRRYDLRLIVDRMAAEYPLFFNESNTKVHSLAGCVYIRILLITCATSRFH